MRYTPALLIVFILVLHRWVEMRSGWPEWIEFPVLGLIGTVLIDRLILPSNARLEWREWIANIGVALAVGTVLLVIGR